MSPQRFQVDCCCFGVCFGAWWTAKIAETHFHFVLAGVALLRTKTCVLHYKTSGKWPAPRLLIPPLPASPPKWPEVVSWKRYFIIFCGFGAKDAIFQDIAKAPKHFFRKLSFTHYFTIILFCGRFTNYCLQRRTTATTKISQKRPSPPQKKRNPTAGSTMALEKAALSVPPISGSYVASAVAFAMGCKFASPFPWSKHPVPFLPSYRLLLDHYIKGSTSEEQNCHWYNFNRYENLFWKTPKRIRKTIRNVSEKRYAPLRPLKNFSPALF